MSALPGSGGLVGKPKVPLALVGSPAIYGTQTSSSNSASSHNVPLPDSEPGQLLLMLTRTGDFAPPTAIAGWLNIGSISNGGGGGSDPCLTAFAREADGSEAATQAVALSSATALAAITYLVEGWTEIAVSPGAVGSSSTPDPDTVTPTLGASAQSLVIALCSGTGDFGGSNDIASTAPAGYGGLTGSRAGLTAMSSAHLFGSGATFNPGTFAKPRNTSWAAMSLAIQ